MHTFATLKTFQKILHFASDSSLDVCIGVFFLILPIQGLYKVDVVPAWYWVLPSTVWLIYVTDHLIDIEKSPGLIPSSRHLLINTFLKQVVWLAVFIFTLNFFLVAFYFDSQTILNGVLLSAVVGAYYFMAFKGYRFFYKEVVAAWVYSSGIILHPYTLAQNDRWAIAQYGVLILVLCLINLLQNALKDYDADKGKGLLSVATQTSPGKVSLWLNLCYLLFFGVLFFVSMPMYIKVAFVLTVLVHAYMKKGNNDYNRITTEWSFCIPGLVYVFHQLFF